MKFVYPRNYSRLVFVECEKNRRTRRKILGGKGGARSRLAFLIRLESILVSQNYFPGTMSIARNKLFIILKAKTLPNFETHWANLCEKLLPVKRKRI